MTEKLHGSNKSVTTAKGELKAFSLRAPIAGGNRLVLTETDSRDRWVAKQLG